MASGSQNMTTYLSKQVIGSNSAHNPAGALLQSGAGRADNSTTGDTWIFLDTIGGTSSFWGFKHAQANNDIEFYGAGNKRAVIHLGSNKITADTFAGNATSASIWQTARTLTIGATGKSVNGSANVSWSKAEIIGSGNSGQFLRGDHTYTNALLGPLLIGTSDAAANTGYATANVGANNYIAFYGVYGDNPGSYNHTYIGESIYGSKTTANKQSELLLFHGNDPAATSGPDRIRLFAGQVDICVYSSATSGTWDAIRQTGGIKVANFANGAMSVTGTITASGTIASTAGYLKSTLNSNTVTIGSQNTSFCHIENSANIPFWFNRSIQMAQNTTIGSASTQYRPFQLYLGRYTTANSNALNATNPLIEFSNSDRSQYCQLIYTDHDTIQAPDSLTLVGNQNGTTFICKNGPIWVQGGSNAGGNVNRLNLSSGMPGNMLYNTSRRGTQIYSNGIAFADPYNGNTNNDAGWIRHIETTANTGYLEIGVGDDGNEEIIARQYNTSSNVARQMYLLNSGGFTSISNQSTDAAYTHAAMQIRETNFSGAGSAVWGQAPRLAWYWSGRVQAQIGLGSDNHLYISENNFTNAYRIVMETGTWGIGISGNAATATNASNTQSGYGAKKITVGGNANTYYPVLITNHTSHFAWTLLNITRGYNEAGPDTWNTNTHRGGLTLTILSNGDTAWGGNHHIGTSKLNCIIDLSEEYTTMVGGVYVTVNGLLVLLRGGNADYWITSNNGQAVSASITLGTFTASDKKTYAARTSPDTANLSAMRWNNLWTVANATTSSSCTGNAATATKATQDGSGNTITSKYVTVDTTQTITGTKSFGASGAGCQINGAGSNGGLNSIRVGDDIWLGDCNNGGILGLKANASSTNQCGFFFYNGAGTQIGQFYSNGTVFSCNKPIYATANAIPLFKIERTDSAETSIYLKNATAGWAIGIRSWGVGAGVFAIGQYAGTGSSAWRFKIDNSGYCYAASRMYNAVWNDYAEYRKVNDQIPGYAVNPFGNLTTQRLEAGARIVSDTYGHSIGYMENDETLAPLALAGRVLAYPLHDKSYYEVGDAVCAAEGGKIDKMTREEIMMYPDRILGIVNEIPDYDIWEPSLTVGGREPVHTNGRIWIDIK